VFTGWSTSQDGSAGSFDFDTPPTSGQITLYAQWKEPLEGVVTISGTPAVGQTLSVDTSGITSPDPLGTLSYEWLRGTTVVGTASSYTPMAADVNQQISVRITAANYAGSLTSPTVTVNQGQIVAGTVAITGTAQAGHTLTPELGDPTPAAAVPSFSWTLPDGTVLGTGVSFKVPVSAVGKVITFTATWALPGYTDATASAATGRVTAAGNQPGQPGQTGPTSPGDLANTGVSALAPLLGGCVLVLLLGTGLLLMIGRRQHI
jgi:uncharacterized repeat protein (TIGR02543 family)